MNLVLVGYRGSGKSSVGVVLAKRLGWKFVDLDDLVRQRAGRTIRQLLETEGEAGFRRLEREACEQLRKSKNQVVATGGGTLCDAETQAAVRRLGKLVWLTAPPAVLWARISRDPRTASERPDLTPIGGLVEVEATLKERAAIYENASNHIVNTMNATPEEAAEAIEMWFRAGDTDNY